MNNSHELATTSYFIGKRVEECSLQIVLGSQLELTALRCSNS